MTENKEELINYLKYIKHDNRKRFAIYFNFSKLNEDNKSNDKIRIAINIIKVFFNNNPTKIYKLDNLDIVIIHECNDYKILEKLIYELRYLFIDDHLAFIDKDIENPEFCLTYNLHNDWDMCFEGLTKQDLYRNNRENAELNLNLLSSLENKIMNSDIFPLLRTQNVVVLSHNHYSKVIFAEIYVSINKLFDQFNYKINVNRNSLLFRYITSKLDIQVLKILKSRISSYVGKSISINLNVETILSKNFDQFDQNIDISQKKSIIIEINIADIFFDIASFTNAKEYLQKLGYRVCLDGLDYSSFIQINRKTLGADLIKLQWSSNNIQADINDKLVEAIKKSDSHRIILCRCDSDKAIEFGKILNISMFQGWYVDNYNS